MYNYLISNRELIFAILIASVRAISIAVIFACTVQTVVYQITKKINGKGYSIYNEIEKFVLEG
jgi:hypothetical protein